MTQGNIYNIMIGSPSDVIGLAKLAIRSVLEWNINNSTERKMTIISQHWSVSSYPSLRHHPQDEINAQIVENSDALIAIFGSKLGTPTDEHVSGTAEEIEEHRKADKPVMVFFCNKVDLSGDISEIQRLKDYRDNLHGLYCEYSDAEDFEVKLKNLLTLWVQGEFPKISDNKRQKETIEFTPEEVEIITKGVNSHGDKLYKIAYMGGSCHFRFGTFYVETSTAKERAQFEDLYKRMELAGLIEFHKVDSHSNPVYKFTLLAYEKFSN